MEKFHEDLHNKILELRNLEGLINSPAFLMLHQNSSIEERETVMGLLVKHDFAAVQNWIRYHPLKEFGEMSVRQLKEAASKKRIAGYSRMDKPTLIACLQKVTEKMSVSEIIDTIKQLCNDFVAIADDIGIDRDQYLLPDISALNEELIIDAYSWITSVHNTGYQKVLDIKSKQSQEIWDRYMSWGEGFGEHQEVVVLKAAQLELRKILQSSSRPVLFKRSKLREYLARK